MIAIHDVTVAACNAIKGPWRAVVVLGVTQIIAWGTMFYAPVFIVPQIAAERGWSITFAMGGFSVGLLMAGLSASFIGRSIDRFGGHVTMTIGSLTAALGLVLVTQTTDRFAYFAAWMMLGVAMAANLYDAAFASLGRIFGAAARRPITALTLAGGFASTVSWPLTQSLLGMTGWHGTYLVYAALLACVCAPLHAFALPRGRVIAEAVRRGKSYAPVKALPPRGLAFVLVAAAFAAYAFVPSALSAHLLAIFTRAGIDPAAVVLIGMCFGPAQVGARIMEFAFGRNAHPLWIARGALFALLGAFVVLILAGISPVAAAIFALMFGGSNGLITIARGAVPLALFGASGYGQLVGRLAGPWLIMQAAAPLLMAVVIERFSDQAALILAALLTAIALLCFLLIKRP
jgi:hypothetical protein